MRYVGLVLVLGSAACSGADRATAGGGRTGGTVVIVEGTTPDPLNPATANSNATFHILDQLFETLAGMNTNYNPFGDHDMVPQLADRWSWAPDSLSIAFHIDPRARWHDRVPVRASDVRYSFKIYTDTALGSPVAVDLQPIDSVTVRDSLTAVFWFHKRYPLEFHDAATIMYVLPEHILASTKAADLRTAPFGQHPIGTGRFRFVRWTPGQSVELTADTLNYHGRPLLDNLVFLSAPNYAGALVKVYAGDADIFDAVHPEDVADAAKHPSLALRTYADPSYVFLGFDLKNPLFADRAMRRALTMAVDRWSMLRNVFDTLAVVPHGPYFQFNSVADTTLPLIAYDTAAADRTLDSLGWKLGRDGIRHRGGRPLAFTISVPTSSKGRMRYAVLLQDQLHRVGVATTIESLEFPTFIQHVQSHQFDAYLQAFIGDISPDGIVQTWTSGGIAGGRNYGGYRNGTFDALVDSGMNAFDISRARAYFRRAFVVINDDAPGIWLYEPLQVAAIERRIHPSEMRADGWWTTLADWYILPGDRIARDRIGVQSP
jgi:peptide/nickel transport system substrate-binding protein